MFEIADPVPAHVFPGGDAVGDEHGVVDQQVACEQDEPEVENLQANDDAFDDDVNIDFELFKVILII